MLCVPRNPPVRPKSPKAKPQSQALCSREVCPQKPAAHTSHDTQLSCRASCITHTKKNVRNLHKVIRYDVNGSMIFNVQGQLWQACLSQVNFKTHHAIAEGHFASKARTRSLRVTVMLKIIQDIWGLQHSENNK